MSNSLCTGESVQNKVRKRRRKKKEITYHNTTNKTNEFTQKLIWDKTKQKYNEKE